MKTRLWLGFSLAGAVFVSAGCTFPSSGPVIPANQANQLQTTEPGTVVRVARVTVEGRRSNLGQYGGGVVGGAAALPAGGVKNTGEALGVAAASVVGAVVGEATEEYLTRKEAEELTVLLEDGRMVTIVETTQTGFQVGDKVHVIHRPAGAQVALALNL